MNLDAALRFARRWLPLLLLGPLAGGLAGHVVVRQVPPVYEATVTLLVGQGITSTNPGSDELNGAGQLAQTYAEAVRTRPVLAEAAAQQGLSLSIRELQERVQARRRPAVALRSHPPRPPADIRRSCPQHTQSPVLHANAYATPFLTA